MVFSSVPTYLDPPERNQSFQFLAAAGGSSEASQLFPWLEAQGTEAGVAAAGSARPISMAERALLAKIPQPEQPHKCPRCDSSDTKFCYFNNYSLSQPRHFCKTCRRYWTRGGALRNVPVGGACRRNKRNKSSGSSSKSTATTSTADRRAGTSSSSSTAAGGGNAERPFFSSMHTLVDPAGYQVGRSSLGVGLERWRKPQIQQFPFLGGLEPRPEPPAYRLNGEGVVSAKIEDNSHELRLPRQCSDLLGTEQYWSGGGGEGGSTNSGGWATQLSVFSSSTKNIS
ncbi:unnamed protein product [Musa acuminata var. zebrina]